MAQMAHHDEIELKFDLDARAARKVRRHRLLAETDRRKWIQRTVYFDTCNGKLRKKGYSLRVRQIGDRFTQTVKTSGRSAGLFNREEWESPVRRMHPELSALEKTPLARLKNFDRLEPIAQFDVDRTSWTIEIDGAAIEVVLDSGRLRAGRRKAPLHELEIELKNGDAHAIFAVAQELSHAAPMEIGVLSKEERGFLLARNALGRGQKASALDIRRKMDVRQAFEMCVRECVRHFRLNEQAIIVGRDPEAVHQARVAMRRLRTAFSFFRPAIRQGEFARLRQKLRDFTLLFGKARNIDVFLARHRQELRSTDRKRLSVARDEAYAGVIAAMGTQQTRGLFLELVEWAASDDWVRGCADGPIEAFAGKQLDKIWKKLKRKGSKLPDLEEEELHRLRITTKKLRYALEFVAALYSKKRTRKFTKTLEKIQNCLGQLHDDMTARQLIEEFSLDFRAKVERTDQARRLKAAEAHFKRLKGEDRPWSR